MEKWERKEHFEFFSAMDEPFYCVTSNVNCTRGYRQAKKENRSFFIYYLYQALKAVNSIEEFRYRIEDGNVVIYDRIHVSATIARKDNTFAFTYIDYDPEIEIFTQNAKKEIARVQKKDGLLFNPEMEKADTVHFSSLPWINFTGLTHARNYGDSDSVPKITFGKMHKKGKEREMPVSVMVHHGLVDGYHVGKYFSTLQEMLDGEA